MILDITQLVVAQPEMCFSVLVACSNTQVVVSGSICSSEKKTITFHWDEVNLRLAAGTPSNVWHLMAVPQHTAHLQPSLTTCIGIVSNIDPATNTLE